MIILGACCSPRWEFTISAILDGKLKKKIWEGKTETSLFSDCFIKFGVGKLPTSLYDCRNYGITVGRDTSPPGSLYCPPCSAHTK